MAKMSYLDVLMEKESARAIVPSIVEAIRGFDPIGQYAMADVNEPAFKSLIQYKIEVGKNSNLFHDMCQYGATEEELVRAIKYGMVVVDAQKHFLDWKQAKKDFRIDELYKKYRHLN